MTPREKARYWSGEWMFPMRLLTSAEKHRYYSGSWLFPDAAEVLREHEEEE